jgi:hypothetical protein
MRRLRAWIFALLAIGLAVWAVAGSQRFRDCMDAGGLRTVLDGSQLSVEHLVAVLGAGRDCVGDFLNANGTAVIAAFAVVLALSTVLLWGSTRNAAYAARAAAERIPRVERAYIVGGGPGRLRDQQGVPVPDKGWVSVGNYGRTPAVLTRIEWGFCDEIEFPTNRPVSQLLDRNLLPAGTVNSLQKDDVYRPGGNPSLIEGTDFHLAENVGMIFFGRLTYRILFDDDEHFSTFKLKIGPNAQSSGLPGCYSDWT